MKDYVGQTVASSYITGDLITKGSIEFHKEYVEFRSFAFSMGTGSVEIKYTDISEISRVKGNGFLQTGICIKTNNNIEYIFSVKCGKDVIDFLCSMMTSK